MPRGKKAYTPAEELEMIISKISAAEEELKQLKARKKELEKMIEETEIRELYELVKKSGKTAADVMDMIKPEE